MVHNYDTYFAHPSKKKDELAIQKTMDLYTAVISRLTEHSRQCKTWAVTMASAFILLSTKIEQISFLVCILPLLALFVLDLYYLNMERQFRHSHEGMIQAFHRNKLHRGYLYTLKRLEFGAIKQEHFETPPQNWDLSPAGASTNSEPKTNWSHYKELVRNSAMFFGASLLYIPTFLPNLMFYLLLAGSLYLTATHTTTPKPKEVNQAITSTMTTLDQQPSTNPDDVASMYTISRSIEEINKDEEQWCKKSP